MNDTMNLRDTIAPKSDQLNADDLIAGTITVKIMGVRRGSRDQPVIIDIDGGRQPYKPCLSMRRVMIAAWGDNGGDWVGKSMVLYNDPTVKFGKVAMGGIRISHMSHIEIVLSLMLTTTRARRSKFEVQPLRLEPTPPELKVVHPDNKPLWKRAIDRFIIDGNLSVVKEHATITEEVEKILIAAAEKIKEERTEEQARVDEDNY